jgi:uridine phosphorylase
METFHLLHLANSWPRPTKLITISSSSDSQNAIQPPPPISPPIKPHVLPSAPLLTDEADETILYPNHNSRQTPATATSPSRRIRAAAVQMIFADRATKAFISPQEVEVLQEATAKALLETLATWQVQA